MEENRDMKEGRREEEGRGGEYVMLQRLSRQQTSHPASQSASQASSLSPSTAQPGNQAGTLMTIMSCHTSRRSSRRTLPLPLPFPDQWHRPVPGVKGQGRIDGGEWLTQQAEEGRPDSRQINDTLVCHGWVMVIHLPLNGSH